MVTATTELTCPICSNKLYAQKIVKHKLDNKHLDIIIKETNLLQCSSCSKIVIPRRIIESLLSSIALCLFEAEQIFDNEEKFLSSGTVLQMKEGLSHPYYWSIKRRNGKITAEVLYEA